MSGIVGPKTGSGSILGVVVLALSGWAAFGVWWFLLRADPAEAAVEVDEPARWASMEREILELRREVEELRREQERMASAAVLPFRGEDRLVEESASFVAKAEKDGKASDANNAKAAGAEARRGKNGWDPELWERAQQLEEIEDPAERRALADQLLAADNVWLLSEGIMALLEEDPAAAVAQLERLATMADDGGKGPYALERTLEELGELQVAGAAAELRRLHAQGALDAAPFAAARAMERFGDPRPMQEHVRRFSQGLSSDDFSERIESIEELGETGSPQAVPHLLPLLDHPDIETRLRAVEAIGWTGRRSEIARIEALLNDPVAAVRDRAVEALADLRRRWGG